MSRASSTIARDSAGVFVKPTWSASLSASKACAESLKLQNRQPVLQAVVTLLLRLATNVISSPTSSWRRRSASSRTRSLRTGSTPRCPCRSRAVRSRRRLRGGRRRGPSRARSRTTGRSPARRSRSRRRGRRRRGLSRRGPAPDSSRVSPPPRKKRAGHGTDKSVAVARAAEAASRPRSTREGVASEASDEAGGRREAAVLCGRVGLKGAAFVLAAGALKLFTAESSITYRRAVGALEAFAVDPLPEATYKQLTALPRSDTSYANSRSSPACARTHSSPIRERVVR